MRKVEDVHFYILKMIRDTDTEMVREEREVREVRVSQCVPV